MCGRARCTLSLHAVPAACGFRAPLRIVDADRYHPSYNVPPGSYMPIVCYEQQESAAETVLHIMKWGLVPSFTKKQQKPDHFRMFNARSESVLEKASFRRLLPKRRCLATVDGFYEWKKDGSKKQPFYIHFQDCRPIVFAGLYDSWEDDEGGILYSFTILTTQCSKSLEWLHDRMPVILGSSEAIEGWMNKEISVLSLKKLTQPYEASDLVWYPVTPAMGKISFDGPECIKEIKSTFGNEETISHLFGRHTSHKSDVNSRVDEDNKGMKSDDIKPDLWGGATLSDEELKAFVVGLQPDQDITHKWQDDKLEKEAGDCKTMEINVSRGPGIQKFVADTYPHYEVKEGKQLLPDSPQKSGLKRKHTQKSIVTEMGGDVFEKGKQKTLLTFYGRQ